MVQQKTSLTEPREVCPLQCTYWLVRATGLHCVGAAVWTPRQDIYIYFIYFHFILFSTCKKPVVQPTCLPCSRSGRHTVFQLLVMENNMLHLAKISYSCAVFKWRGDLKHANEYILQTDNPVCFFFSLPHVNTLSVRDPPWHAGRVMLMAWLSLSLTLLSLPSRILYI